MKQLELKIQSDSGLHARPASMLVALAQKYSSNIELEKNGQKVNAKSIMSLLSLGGAKGDDVVIFIEGDDELAAADAVTEFFTVTLVHA